MEAIRLRAEFARNVAEAHAVLAYMRAVTRNDKGQIARSRDKLEESWTVLKKKTPKRAKPG